jgi:hypothetical protein
VQHVAADGRECVRRLAAHPEAGVRRRGSDRDARL